MNHINWNRWLLNLALALMLTLVCCAAMADVEINETNFPDAYFRNYVAVNFDTAVKDDMLSDAEIRRVTSISCSGNNIATLKGIEYFSALQVLSCDANKLTELNLRKNTALQYLDCEDNQLTSLDVRENTALTELICYDNMLTTLDVSENNALTGLFCSYNELTTLDVGENTALTTLYCYGNELTALDVSKNTKLTHLNCRSNRLKALDVSKNTALTELACESNQFAALDVKNCPALNRLVAEYQPTNEESRCCWSVDGNYLSADKTLRIITTKGVCVGPNLLAGSLSLNKDKAALTRTGSKPKPTLQLEATVLPVGVTDKSVTWSSDKPKIAAVNKNGKVTALKAGTATITCTANDGSGKSAKCVITVKDAKVTRITLSKSKASLKVKKTLQLKVKKFTPASPLNTKVKWTSSNKKVAKVDKNGKVTAVKAGTCEIKCTAQDGSKVYAVCKITVK